MLNIRQQGAGWIRVCETDVHLHINGSRRLKTIANVVCHNLGYGDGRITLEFNTVSEDTEVNTTSRLVNVSCDLFDDTCNAYPWNGICGKLYYYYFAWISSLLT